MYGWTEAEALSMNIRQLTPESGQAAALAVVRQLSVAAILEPYHMERIAKDGSIVRVSLAATALVDESGTVYAIATTERMAT
jgi:two-component system CheB/CheR fusion protein